MTADPADPFREPALTTHPVSAERCSQTGDERKRSEAHTRGLPGGRRTQTARDAADAEALWRDGVTGSSCGLERRAPEEAGCTYPMQYRQPAGDIPDAFEPGDDAQTGAQGTGWSNNGSAVVLVRRRSIQRRRRSTCTTEIDCAMSLSPLWRASSNIR